MLAPFKYLLAFPAFFLMLYGTMPVAVSAMYGGNPPPHIANLLDQQMKMCREVALLIFGPIAPSSAAANGTPKQPP